MPLFNRAQILCWIVTTCLTLVHIHDCTAQFTDNFSDGDFTDNPVWTPNNAANWTIFNNQLRSNSGTTGAIFYMTTPSTKAVNAQWEFFVNLQFSTSNANFIDIYLMSDLSDLANATNNGYFIKVGGTPDEISLYKLTAGVPNILINGADGITNGSNNTLRIKVIRDAANMWQVSRDITGTGNNYVVEGATTDGSFATSNFFGIRVQQSTATFFNKHFFDDIYVGDIIVDSDPPQLVNVQAVSSTELLVTFNEKVDATTAQTITNYTVNNGIGNPTMASLQADEEVVRLTFAQPFPNAITCQLTVSDVDDLFSNTLGGANSNFLFFQPIPAAEKDIIITEIFADPSPHIGLPELEFVEIYNRSNKTFDLQNWKITDGSSTGSLPTHLIRPNEYVILTATSSAASFVSFATVLGVSNFPTLNNTDETLIIKDNIDLSIDRVSYNDSWYQDEDKKQGGYTLELIDPTNPCGEADNWIASESASGGTPGAQNSVFENKPDLTGPKLISAVPISETQVLVKFDEKLEAEEPLTTSFTITPEIIIDDIIFTDASLTEFNITLNGSLQTGILYTLVTQDVYDCNGNEVQPEFSRVEFALPEVAEEKDIVLNEVLFNPRPTGIDFVEIYNTSDKYINLKNWTIANYVNEEVVNPELVTSEDMLLKPHSYLVLTEDRNVVKGEYVKALEENILVVEDLPSLNDDEGTIALINPERIVIDFFSYSDDYHAVFLKDDEGVSLERISTSTLTNDAANWQSASSAVGFATPGYVNSNTRGESLADKVNVDPEIFEPITGQPSFAQIHYNFASSGFVANIKILDHRGREIKQIANNATLSTSGFFRWDGDMNDGTKARTGYYIVWIEVFNANGKVDSFRKKVVVASSF